MSRNEAHDPDISDLQLRLLSDWGVISAYRAFAHGFGPPPETLGLPRLASPLPEESQLEIARRWASIFQEEIDTIELARNAVAHARPMSNDSVHEAARVADRLLKTLETGFKQETVSQEESKLAAG